MRGNLQIVRGVLAGFVGTLLGFVLLVILRPWIARLIFKLDHQELTALPSISLQGGAHLMFHSVPILLILGMLQGCAYAILASVLPGRGWRKGLTFSAFPLLLTYLLYQQCVPWGWLYEPAPMTMFEMSIFWIPVSLATGVSIALVFDLGNLVLAGSHRA